MPNPIPKGFGTVTPFLKVADSAQLVDFLKQAFAAHLTFRLDAPDGSLIHAEMKIGDSMVRIGQAPPSQEMLSMINLYVPDADALYHSAIAAGAASIREPEDQFYGDRSGGARDIWGNRWWIATHMEDVSQAWLLRFGLLE
jgi:uncharacterized glyoxalase superfamily protein PhnB